MERKLKRQQRTVGAIVKIPLENGYHTYARILEDDFAFYKILTKKNIDINDIIELDVLFFTTVYDTAVTKGYWPKIGKRLPLESCLQEKPPLYTQDRLNPDKYTIYKNGKEIAATKQECKGLEYFAVWSYERIEKRLNDYYSGRTNPYVQKMHKAEMYSNKPKKKKLLTA